MVDKIYDTIKGILYTDFPKDNQGYPQVYDRIIQQWFFGNRQILPSPLGVVLRGTTSNIKDIGFGLREIEYSIKITFYSNLPFLSQQSQLLLLYFRAFHHFYQ